MPPPKGNFEKLQDILMRRKGLSLDVSSSGALAASLDLCLVSVLRLSNLKNTTERVYSK